MFNFKNQKGNSILGIILAVIITALVVGGGVYYWEKQESDNSLGLAQKQIQDNQVKIDDLQKQLDDQKKVWEQVTDKVVTKYSLELFGSANAFTDSKIIKTHSDGSTEVIVPSTVSAFGSRLCEVSLPVDGNKLYFLTCSMDNDDAGSKLVVYDLTSASFKYLENINKFFIGWGHYIVSPIYPDKMFYVPDSYAQNGMKGVEGLDQVMYSISLNEDTAVKFVTLTGNETFNKGCGALSSQYDFSWSNDTTIKYTVFKQPKGNCYQTTAKEKIAERTISILENGYKP